MNQAHADVYGYDDPDVFLGEHWKMCYSDEEYSRFQDEIIPALSEDGAWRGEATGKKQDGTTFPQEISLMASESGGIICVVRDITDRKENERQLREAREFNEELVENAPFGMFRLDEELRITYENPRAEEIIGLPDEKESSAAIGLDISELPPIVETGQSDLFKSLKHSETIEFSFPFESIYGKEAYFTGRAVPVHRDGEFDGAILMATDISERRQYERDLERQREQLAALDELNNVVRGITTAVIEQSTRTEIEQVVCDRLADSGSYRFAWVGSLDSAHDLETRVWSGCAGENDDVPPVRTLAESTEQGPVRKAIDTKRMQVIQNARQELSSGALRDHASQFDYSSLAIIPILHQGVLYGVLGVGSERPDAFAEAEREVIGQLSDVIGHAIAAVDHKRALISEEVIELELQIPDLFDTEDVPPTAGTITIERMTPLGGNEYLMYGRLPEGAIPVLEGLSERLQGWKDLQTFYETDGVVRFEQHLSAAPLTSAIADHRGNFKQGRIENGAFSATIQLPPGIDVRSVIGRVQETYPAGRLVRQQQVTRSAPSLQDLVNLLTDDLTERQRVAIEAGYFGGFFNSPRHRTGGEIADSLNIDASTYHQHVRKAQSKLLEVIFEEL